MNEEALDERLRALSHPARRTLYEACLGAARPAGELAELIELAPASVSEHLKVLRKSGLLSLERDGRFRLYRADAKAAQEVARAVAELGRLSESAPSRRKTPGRFRTAIRAADQRPKYKSGNPIRGLQ